MLSLNKLILNFTVDFLILTCFIISTNPFNSLNLCSRWPFSSRFLQCFFSRFSILFSYSPTITAASSHFLTFSFFFFLFTNPSFPSNKDFVNISLTSSSFLLSHVFVVLSKFLSHNQNKTKLFNYDVIMVVWFRPIFS